MFFHLIDQDFFYNVHVQDHMYDLLNNNEDHRYNKFHFQLNNMTRNQYVFDNMFLFQDMLPIINNFNFTLFQQNSFTLFGHS